MREEGGGRVRVGATGVRGAAFGGGRAHLGRDRRGLWVQDGASTTTPVAEVREEGVDGERVVVGPAPRESPAGTASAAAVLGGGRPTIAQWPLRSGFWCPLLPARIGEVTGHLPSSAAEAHRSPGDPPCAQDQGLGQHREGVLGGSEGEPVRERCSPARLRLRGHNELLAAPTFAAPTQAAQLGRLGSFGGPPVSWEKKRSSLEDERGRLSWGFRLERSLSLMKMPSRLRGDRHGVVRRRGRHEANLFSRHES